MSRTLAKASNALHTLVLCEEECFEKTAKNGSAAIYKGHLNVSAVSSSEYYLLTYLRRQTGDSERPITIRDPQMWRNCQLMAGSSECCWSSTRLRYVNRGYFRDG